MDNDINVEKYYSNSLDKILRKYITSEKYGKFKDIILEVFQRRAHAFEFSDEEIESQVINFVKNVQAVKVEPKSDKNTAGTYSQEEMAIILNGNDFSNFEEVISKRPFDDDLLLTFTHEVYHAISDKNGIVGLNYYDERISEWKGTSLDEVVTERAARVANESCGMKVSKAEGGYGDITFLTNLLATSIGLSEKEFLKAGIQDRKALRKVMTSKFPNQETSMYAMENMFETVEESLDIIYNLKYSKYQGLNDDMKEQLLGASLTSLYQSSFEMMQFQIAKDEVSFSDQYALELSDRFQKMKRIMYDSIVEFRLPKNIENAIMRDIQEPRDWVQDQVSGIEVISTQGARIKELEPKAYASLVDLARKGRLYEQRMFLRERGIDTPYARDRSREEVPVDIRYDTYMSKVKIGENKSTEKNDEGR